MIGPMSKPDSIRDSVLGQRRYYAISRLFANPLYMALGAVPELARTRQGACAFDLK
jgi:hypothetical protein